MKLYTFDAVREFDRSGDDHGYPENDLMAEAVAYTEKGNEILVRFDVGDLAMLHDLLVRASKIVKTAEARRAAEKS